MIDKPGRKLPLIHARRLRDPSKLFEIEQLDLEFSNGELRTYERMKSRGLGAVIIVPMLDDDTVLLVREYAVGLEHYEIGLPKGRLEDGESILEGAERELKEEIGYGARDLRELTRLSLAPGYMTHITRVVLARDLYGPGALGKTEAWLVIDADPSAQLVTAPAADIDEASLRAAIAAGTASHRHCHRQPAVPGETLLIRAGTLHAIGAGAL